MNYKHPERLDALTRAFVLGTLSRRARRRFSALADSDDDIAAHVYRLEDELSPLAWSLAPVAPSALVWRRIAGLTRRRPDGVPPAHAGSASRWPAVAATLLLGLIGAGYGWWAAVENPAVRIVEVPTEPAISIVADDNGDALWVARLYPDLGRARVVVATPPDAQSTNDYELWVLGNDGVPVSLGLLPQAGNAELTLSANAVAALDGAITLAVSLEPLGGSTGPIPSGPVLYTGDLLAP